MEYVYIFLSIILLLIIRYYISRRIILKTGCLDGNTLIVTAHPDDECMFFAPTILAISNISQNLYILCLSNGNYYGIGHKRKSEFFKSLRILGIPIENGILIDNPRLLDGPNNSWDVKVILDIIARISQTLEIKNILTFDQYGVSGHKNHCAIAQAICRDDPRLSNVNVLFLETVDICHKYLGMLATLWVLCMPNNSLTFTTNLAGLLKIHLAMYSHHSQYTWFRILYILYSRYVYVNQYNKYIQG